MSTDAALLSSCPGREPQVLFPSNEPRHRTGPGAIVWRAAASCPGGAGARVAAIGALRGPGSSSAPPLGPQTAVGVQGPLAASVAPGGRVAVVGRPAGAPNGGAPATGAIAFQGRAGEPFEAIPPGPGFAAPFAATSGYLGDLAVAGRAPGGRLQLQVERFYTTSFVRRSLVSAGPGVRLLTPALDYRSDAMLVWEQGRSILAQYLPANGRPRAPRRLAAAGPGLRITALLSDNRRATVAWSEQQGARTDVYLDRSAPGVRFGEPRLIESFGNPRGIAPPAASPSLIRLSTESVMLAWSSIVGGRWVIDSAAVDQDRVGPRATTSSPAGDALLADLQAGPRADALLLWTEPARDAVARHATPEQAIYAARGFRGTAGRVVFEDPEELAPAGPNSEATVAVDPDSDRTVAVWREGQLLRYSVGEPAPAR
ncbi:MAG TPA: hypothetical protein VLZ06_04040 [Solirubrobacteraceae bacterium]|nr:hypothetical protein [Solirubrobacteraceae bacterium]